ncbi:GolD/DthD family dehydrogenase [Aidingimonas halophila]|uniref:NAD(P)-dependent dehydrogenase, short-chain alcohol dehydrogenase family n=1 Tax=Aidingimonas halophila TaxID=574349 RepID=A0A1H2ZAH7_9GAMM|nr:D-threitol dehydrogenase [Aidingimonas halophila]GHC15671.1 D-threitol dehydrogenase [Aidingimonas halophila]SDX14503.1 NAD(P)-dependent dehydrogenase, short-chain alcohol dehydrogenase family [Aidingimonas halophila]
MSNIRFDFSHRVVLITGAANGIGKAMATRFAECGASLVLVDRSDAVVELARSLGQAHMGAVADVTDEAACESLFEEIDQRFGRLDILVNNAGIGPLEAAESMSSDLWDATQAVNLRGVFLYSRAAGRRMLDQGSGRIINLASQAASVGLEGHLAYCTSKSGVLGLTRTLALEWGPRGITVNAVSPTVVDTELGRYGWAGEKGERMRGLIPTRRFADPDEIVAAIQYLAADEAAMINGADLRIDGGYTAW